MIPSRQWILAVVLLLSLLSLSASASSFSREFRTVSDKVKSFLGPEYEKIRLSERAERDHEEPFRKKTLSLELGKSLSDLVSAARELTKKLYDQIDGRLAASTIQQLKRAHEEIRHACYHLPDASSILNDGTYPECLWKYFLERSRLELYREWWSEILTWEDPLIIGSLYVRGRKLEYLAKETDASVWALYHTFDEFLKHQQDLGVHLESLLDVLLAEAHNLMESLGRLAQQSKAYGMLIRGLDSLIPNPVKAAKKDADEKNSNNKVTGADSSLEKSQNDDGATISPTSKEELTYAISFMWVPKHDWCWGKAGSFPQTLIKQVGLANEEECDISQVKNPLLIKACQVRDSFFYIQALRLYLRSLVFHPATRPVRRSVNSFTIISPHPVLWNVLEPQCTLRGTRYYFEAFARLHELPLSPTFYLSIVGSDPSDAWAHKWENFRALLTTIYAEHRGSVCEGALLKKLLEHTWKPHPESCLRATHIYNMLLTLEKIAHNVLRSVLKMDGTPGIKFTTKWNAYVDVASAALGLKATIADYWKTLAFDCNFKESLESLPLPIILTKDSSMCTSTQNRTQPK